jgi:hypothetical protein
MAKPSRSARERRRQAERVWRTTEVIEGPGGLPWEVSASWATLAGRPECVSVTLTKGARQDRPDEIEWLVDEADRRPILAADLRELPLAATLEHLYAVEEKRNAPLTAEQLQLVVERTLGSIRAQLEGDESTSARELSKLAEVAETYLRAQMRRESPTKAVAAAMDMPYSTAAKWVARARAYGLLGLTTPGRPSGMPTTSEGDDG